MVECCLELIAAHILLHPCLVPWLLGLSRNGARPPWGVGWRASWHPPEGIS